MSGETIVTIVGNVVAAPELRFTPSGAAVANFTVASTPRKFDKNTNQWVDGETLWMNCAVWREMAENVAESLDRGTRVVVQGRLTSRSYTTKQGEKRTVVEMDVDEVCPSLKYATAKVTKTQRVGLQQGQRQGQQQQGGWGQQGGNWDDPWTTGQPAREGHVVPGSQGPQQGGWGSNPNTNPPGNPNAGPGGWGNPPSYGDEPPFLAPEPTISGERTTRTRRWVW